MTYEITTTELEGLSEDQQVAIMESLVLAVTADHKTSPAETNKFDAVVSAIPWRMEPAKVIEHLMEIRNQIVGHKETEEGTALIHRIAERLPDPSLREKLFHAIGSIMAVDGDMSMEEKNVLLVYLKAFGITGEKFEAIKTDIKANATRS